jgi:hypothetical protein
MQRGKYVKCTVLWLGIRDMVLSATFNNIPAISWRSILLVDEPGVPGENHRPAASHGQTLSHNIVTLVVICTDYICPSLLSDISHLSANSVNDLIIFHIQLIIVILVKIAVQDRDSGNYNCPYVRICSRWEPS